MLDRGYGRSGRSDQLSPHRGHACCAAVATQIDLPGAAEGCRLHPRAVAYAFTNTFTEEESRALYEHYHIPASVRALWGSALATLEPGH
jgi:hypothetical protein